MKLLNTFLLFFLFLALVNAQTETKNSNAHKIAIAIHGGASNIQKMNLSPEQQQAYRDGLSEALDSGYAVLNSGGKAVDAVVAAVKVLEDNPLFNAGRGSVFTADSTIEMDASIMSGKSLKCGAITCVHTIKNPIMAARKLLDNDQYVFLSSQGAEKFAQENGCEIVSPEYFKTEFRLNQFNKIKNSNNTPLDNDSRGAIEPIDDTKFEKTGTVGCVAIDVKGNLAAGTSTGGVVNKKYNRIGDSPIIGAGTYANNKTCAVSCTGKGEDFIRLVVAHDISALMEYKKISLKEAVNLVIQKKLTKIEGRGGCIAIDKDGNIEMSFTTTGMFRASIDKNGQKKVSIFPNE
jgi:beta-aspartyl-peptidase (threonine type)